MDQRIRDLEKRCVTMDDTLTMKTSHYDDLEDKFNVVKLAVEQHSSHLRDMKHPSVVGESGAGWTFGYVGPPLICL